MRWKKPLQRIGLGLLATAGLLTLGPPAYVKTQDHLRKDAIEEQIATLEASLSEKYGMDIEIWQRPELLYGAQPLPKNQTSLHNFSPYVALQALQGLEDTLECYPEDIIQDTFNGIELVHEFTPTWYGGNAEKQDITKIANISFGGRISISVGRDSKLVYHRAVLGNIFEEESLHHEIGHELTYGLPEEEWTALHPDVVYHPDDWKPLPELPPGFFNRYATSRPREDIASTVELLYKSEDEYKTRVSDDPILRSKAEFLEQWYFDVSDGRFDDAYWDAIRSGKTPTFNVIVENK